ncbi:probable BOI-related E3 ubiquitin-protein ligase 3 [Vicia villosa]|uniref:probable BOI-related E3 ubiquitin-protein ligase 3 n=1 Tax=Vicia villosa TaxID=3911 RepID=UPI00273AD36E|nr:probable BOI-related E3 ubiquitin-protein ligase 3 [Vicia villosa]
MIVQGPNFPFPHSSNSNVYDATTTKHNYTEFHPEKLEVNQLIESQKETLRILMQEHENQQQVMTILKNEELNFSYILAQKDEQIVEMTNINMELEKYSTKLETDNQLWRKVTYENECMVLSLDNSLEQIKRKNSYYPEDIESCCDMEVLEEETTENSIVCDDHGIATSFDMICKRCYLNESTFLFLPCRHLCSCKPCEHFLKACPVCLTGKKTSIEILCFQDLSY